MIKYVHFLQVNVDKRPSVEQVMQAQFFTVKGIVISLLPTIHHAQSAKNQTLISSTYISVARHI